jgi:tripartite-type tricarboxylate transporter receptor subunit TctC
MKRHCSGNRPVERRKALVLTGAVLAAPRVGRLLTSTAAAAEEPWRPDHPIRVVVPFSPGGLTDVMARLVAEPAAAILGQPLVVENRTGGAGGLIGTDFVAKAAPDGHTILVNSSAHAIAPALVASMPYDAAADFAGITILGGAPMVLVCHPSVPARSLGELVALLRARPMFFDFAGAGVGSTVHLTGEVFRAAAEVEVQFVQYHGGGPALQAVIAGEAHLTAVSSAEAVGPTRSGLVRALAVSVPERSPVLPEVPTATEQGLPDFRQDIWIVAAAPARTARNALAALNAALNAATRRVERRMVDLGVRIVSEVATPERVDAHIRSELVRYAAVLRAAGVRPE